MYRVQYKDASGEWQDWAASVTLDWALKYKDLMKYRYAGKETRIVVQSSSDAAK